jgi:hypothetical protein
MGQINRKITGANSRSYVKHHKVFNNFEYELYVGFPTLLELSSLRSNL